MPGDSANRDPFDSGPEPTLTDLLRAFARSIKLSIRTMVPGKVLVFDNVNQLAKVEVAHLPVVRVRDPQRIPPNMLSMKGTPPDAEATLKPIILPEVPVVFPRTAAGYITFPLFPGDTGSLHMSDRSLEAWLLAGIATDPALAYTHALKDAVFFPGLHPKTAPITPAPALTATVIEGPLIRLGPAAVLAVARATDPVSPSAAMAVWASKIEAAINAVAPGSIPPGDNFATNVLADFAEILSGSVKSFSE